MKRKLKRQIKSKKLMVVGGVALAFLVWLGISVANVDDGMVVVLTYTFPEGRSIQGVGVDGAKDYAVAVDGAVVTEKPLDGNEAPQTPTASTAKMILGLAVMQAKPFGLGESGEMIRIDEEMFQRYVWYAGHNGSNTRVLLGEEISEYDALMSVFLESSNNMADSLAIWAFGSIDAYREYATKMLADWGIHNTVIGEDASGFSETTVSTASDLAIIGAKVMNEPVLAEIVKTKSYDVPVAGKLENTNKLLGQSGIVGIKTGYIGDVSGYCLTVGYVMNERVVTTSLMGAETREESFDKSLELVKKMQEAASEVRLVQEGQEIGHYSSWWTSDIPIHATQNLDAMLWAEAEKDATIDMAETEGVLRVSVAGRDYEVNVRADDYEEHPSLWQRIMRVFGWEYKDDGIVGDEVDIEDETSAQPELDTEPSTEAGDDGADGETATAPSATELFTPITAVPTDNCTVKFGYLMLINPNFTVGTDFIDARRAELVSVSSLYGIVEGNAYNGNNLLDAEAARHLSEMVKAYEAEYPGHTFETRSCYRARGTTCGRLCAATGTSDHHTGLTCDLLDPAYGTSLDTDTYPQHVDWLWLRANSYKYGFIDRFPEAWAGGPMSEPLNVDENGSTGLYETWHYRYVGVEPATEIATGKYNNGQYDSLEHYLKARGLVVDLKNGLCN